MSIWIASSRSKSSPDLAAQNTTLVRFRREAKAAALLRHENIVTIFDVGESNGTHFIAFEFIEGTDLQDHISRKCRLDPEEARRIMIQATRALVHAHEKGIVHRDIKPANFLLTHKDQRLVVKLTDFGLAIRYESDAEFRVTRDKTTVGTVDYMSPEQARDSRSCDIRSDIYSLGCTFYHMLAGLAPFARGTLPERLVHHMQSAPPDMRRLNKSVPEDMVAVIERMLAKKPEDRYQTPAELLSDLEHPDQVAPLKRLPSAGKLVRTSSRKQPFEPTQVIEKKDFDKRSAPIKQAKPARAKKPAAEAAKETAQADESAEIETPEPPGHENVERINEPTRRDRRPRSGGYPMWVVAAAGCVGLLCIVLVLAVVFGDKPPVRNVEKPPVPPLPVVPDPEPKRIDQPPPVVDTSAARISAGPLMLPSLGLPSTKVDQAGARTEYYGPFTAFPEIPAKAAVIHVSRLLTPGPTTFRSLSEAFSQAKPDEFTVIEIDDNGPIFVPSLPPLVQRKSSCAAERGIVRCWCGKCRRSRRQPSAR